MSEELPQRQPGSGGTDTPFLFSPPPGIPESPSLPREGRLRLCAAERSGRRQRRQGMMLTNPEQQMAFLPCPGGEIPAEITGLQGKAARGVDCCALPPPNSLVLPKARLGSARTLAHTSARVQGRDSSWHTENGTWAQPSTARAQKLRQN